MMISSNTGHTCSDKYIKHYTQTKNTDTVRQTRQTQSKLNSPVAVRNSYCSLGCVYYSGMEKVRSTGGSFSPTKLEAMNPTPEVPQ